MTYLELCQALVRESGISGSDNKPATVVNQTGQMRLVVDWIARADTTIQKLWSDWEFMRRTAHISVAANSEFADKNSINWPDNVGHWNRNRFYANANTSEKKKLTYVPWAQYRECYGTSVQHVSSATPNFFTIGNDTSLAVYPPYEKPWLLQAEYFLKPVRMTADDDISPIPEQYHDIILHLARMYYAEYEEAPEVHSSAAAQYQAELQALEAHSLPESYRKNVYADETPIVVVPQ